VSTIKTLVSTKKPSHSVLKNPTNSTPHKAKKSSSDSAVTMSHGTTLSQMTEQVSEIKQSHKMMLDRFNQLAEQMALLISKSNSSPKNPHPEVKNLAR